MCLYPTFTFDNYVLEIASISLFMLRHPKLCKCCCIWTLLDSVLMLILIFKHFYQHFDVCPMHCSCYIKRSCLWKQIRNWLFKCLLSKQFCGSRFSWMAEQYLIHTFYRASWYCKYQEGFIEAWWRIGWVDAFRPKGHLFDSRSSHVGTLGKSFTHSCLWRFSVKFRHSIHAVLGGPLSSSGLEEAL